MSPIARMKKINSRALEIVGRLMDISRRGPLLIVSSFLFNVCFVSCVWILAIASQMRREWQVGHQPCLVSGGFYVGYFALR